MNSILSFFAVLKNAPHFIDPGSNYFYEDFVAQICNFFFNCKKLNISTIYISIILIFFSESTCEIYLQVLKEGKFNVIRRTLRRINLLY